MPADNALFGSAPPRPPFRDQKEDLAEDPDLCGMETPNATPSTGCKQGIAKI